MKKTLAMLLSFILVASVCGMMFVSAEETNLALGKEVANAKVNGSNTNYCANLTDGVLADAISTEQGVWFGYWYNADSTPEVLAEKSNTAENGIAIPTIDLGAATELTSVRMHIVDNADWGISAPTSAIAQVSNDGENFTDVATVTEFTSGVTWVEFDLSGQTAQYVRLAIDLNSSWFFLDEIEIYGAAASEGGNEEPEAPAEGKIYKDTYTVVEGVNDKGETTYTASVEVPYGYTWNITSLNGTIAGEDATICDNQDAYNACNPNWAITLYLEKQADGTYVAIQDAIVCPGSAEKAGIAVDADHIAVVIHSASSDPNQEAQYGNWMGKIVAVSVKAGDVFNVDTEAMTVYAVVPGGSTTPDAGDAGILVFAVLAVVAIAGCAVASKIKSAAY